MTGSQRGFTLIEMIIAIGIFALIMIVIIDLLLKNNSLIRTQEAAVDTMRSARTIMSDIHTTVRQSTGVMATHVFSGTLYASATSTLVLEVPSITSSGSIVSSTYDYVAYHASGTILYRLTHAGGGVRQSGTRELTNLLSSFTVDYDTNDLTFATSTDIDLVVQKSTDGTDAEVHLKEKIFFRNK